MALDAGIYGLMGQGVKSVDEYDKIAQEREANKLALLMHQMQYGQAQQGMADDNALREATRQFGVDPMANRSLIAGTGNYKALQSYDKAQQDAAKAAVDTAKTKAETTGLTQKQAFDLHDKHLQELSNVAAPEDAQRWLLQGLQSGALTQDQALLGIKNLGDAVTKPGGFEQWKANAKQAGTSVKDQLEMAMKGREFGLKANNEIIGADGTVNQTYLDAKKSIAKSGASNVNVKVDNALGEGVAKQVGPMVENSYNSAMGAQASIANANNIVKAIDSGKVIAGPGADLRLKGAQIAETLGIGGKDTAEKISNTRAAIQGLNQSIVTARAQLKGQGQVSDYEGKLLAKATSGDINDLTAPEIRQLALVSQRLATQVMAQHQQLIGKLKKHDPTAPLADLFETLPGNATEALPPTTAAPSSGGVPPDIAAILQKHGRK